MSVTVVVAEIFRDVEGFSVDYVLEYASTDNTARFSVSYESRGPDEYEAAADAIESGESYFAGGGPANGEASFEVRNGGLIEFIQSGYGNGHGGSLCAVLPAAPWGAAFREIAQVLRTGKPGENTQYSGVVPVAILKQPTEDAQ